MERDNYRNEVWKPISKYEGRYEVSDAGRVKSLERRVSNGKGCRVILEKILKPGMNLNGYPIVALCKNCIHKTNLIHQLVMHEFLGKRALDIDHINGDKTDNRLENLRYATRTQNNANSKSTKNSSSKYKGVCWYKRDKKWQADITKDYKQYYIGKFYDEKEAALAYNKKAVEFFGEFARLNIIT